MTHRTLALAAAPSSTTGGELFDRTHERQLMDKLVKEPPVALRVVVGPKSCGKTAFMQDYMETKKLGKSICYINCRDFDATTPSSFASYLEEVALPQCLQRLPDKVLAFVSERLPFLSAAASALTLKIRASGSTSEEVAIAAKEYVGRLIKSSASDNKSSMQVALNAYGKLLTAWETSRLEGKLISKYVSKALCRFCRVRSQSVTPPWAGTLLQALASP
jgi:hypothetical protein